jgi:hypothetical protein
VTLIPSRPLDRPGCHAELRSGLVKADLPGVARSPLASLFRIYWYSGAAKGFSALVSRGLRDT